MHKSQQVKLLAHIVCNRNVLSSSSSSLCLAVHRQRRLLPVTASIRMASTQSQSDQIPAKKTSLYDFHVQHKGKLVDFAGYLLPVQYANLSISASHLHTRQHASIFDVSHMLQTYVCGKHAIECFESICTADISGLAPNTGTLTVFTNERGGILDDLIVTKVSNDLLYVVSNAACRKQDITIIQSSVVGRGTTRRSVRVLCLLKYAAQTQLQTIDFQFSFFVFLSFSVRRPQRFQRMADIGRIVSVAKAKMCRLNFLIRMTGH